MSNMRLLIFTCTAIALLFSCQNGNKDQSSPTDSNSHSLVDPMPNNPAQTIDSIQTPNLKDTAGLDEYAKDSLRMAIAFQIAANDLSRAFRNKDVIAYCKYSPPTLIKMFGGIEKYRSRVKESFEKNPVAFSRILSGPVKRVKAALDDDQYAHGWYCLIPVRRFTVENGQEVMEMQWLGGQTLDEGKNICFLDVTGKTREQIMQIMPDLRFVLDEETNP